MAEDVRIGLVQWSNSDDAVSGDADGATVTSGNDDVLVYTINERDSAPILRAKEKFSFVVKNYPNSDFALDSKFKLDLIQDILAAKEMYLGRHYQKKEKWIASINRFKNVLDSYDETIFVEEALHRLVEINYKLGINEESQKYASILGYNYQSSEWYKKSYKILNKDYSFKTSKDIKKDKKGVIKKFKKLFE